MHQALDLGLLLGLRKMPEIQYGQVDVDCRMYHLAGLALFGSKGRAQALVAVDNRLQRLPQRVCVQRPSMHSARGIL